MICVTWDVEGNDKKKILFFSALFVLTYRQKCSVSNEMRYC